MRQALAHASNACNACKSDACCRAYACAVSPPLTRSVNEATLECLLWLLVDAVHIPAEDLLRGEVLCKRIRRVSSPWDFEERDDLAINKLLEEAATTRNVREALDAGSVARDHDNSVVVAPNTNGLTAKAFEGQEG